MRAITRFGLACVAAVLRNMLCRRHSACPADQFIVSETVFGFFYFIAWSGQWPGCPGG